ncbi:CLUMA_CG015522, isoform A [Clunio marinus]|uniref:CLUMA_CG015522, isoform A n=1 Tax=Clunio marinus TaxID=568069 RepID=A0A1J1ISJ8_9DIPT|nr:CLUMA_CG015522, isoform A [Clunio marinus]
MNKMRRSSYLSICEYKSSISELISPVQAASCCHILKIKENKENYLNFKEDIRLYPKAVDDEYDVNMSCYLPHIYE